jgi:hypothetical protein
MATVRRANVVLRIDDNLIDTYVARGFNVIASDGTVLREAVPTDIHTLQGAWVSMKNEIKALKAEIERLKESTEKPVEEEKPRRKSAKKTVEE